ncbi:hypothetical protein RF11_16401 [Thelohanellus kitauei]|uniref:Uncharacterized protein n=1 Tax=Thelohanellus kitauei TaxID=669202 RepID=A0A0C2M9C0_THEKT|nr:hypothetical protein RF11_16401 [Thelohanellus kitauei]
MMMDVVEKPGYLNTLGQEPVLIWHTEYKKVVEHVIKCLFELGNHLKFSDLYSEFRKVSNIKLCCVATFQKFSNVPLFNHPSDEQSTQERYINDICESIRNDVMKCHDMMEYVPFKEYFSSK